MIGRRFAIRVRNPLLTRSAYRLINAVNTEKRKHFPATNVQKNTALQEISRVTNHAMRVNNLSIVNNAKQSLEVLNTLKLISHFTLAKDSHVLTAVQLFHRKDH